MEIAEEHTYVTKFHPIIQNYLKKTCIIEAKKSVDSEPEWKPFDGYRESLFQHESIRLSENAQTLIKQVWGYVNLQNQQ